MTLYLVQKLFACKKYQVTVETKNFASESREVKDSGKSNGIPNTKGHSQ